MLRVGRKIKLGFLFAGLSSMFLGVNYILRIRLPKEELDWLQMEEINRGVLFVVIGVLSVLWAVVMHLVNSRNNNSIKTVLSWHFVMFRWWVVMSSIICFVAAELLQSVNDASSVMWAVFGWILLGLIIVVQSCTVIYGVFVKKKKR